MKSPILVILALIPPIYRSEQQACFIVKTYDEILDYSGAELKSMIGSSPSSNQDSGGWKRSFVSNQDDGCFDRVPLPFTFPWSVNGGERVVALSPNGALHFGSHPEQCCQARRRCDFCYFASPGQCDLARSYWNLIAPFVTDLNPGSSRFANISFNFNADVFMARWAEVPFYFNHIPPFGQPPITNNTFETSLFKNGTIRMRLEEITDPWPVCCWTQGSTPSSSVRREWLVGIRPPQDHTKGYSNTPNFAGWNVSRRGYYPNHGKIRSGVTVDFIRTSVSFCSYPSIIPNTTTTLTILLATHCSICSTCTYEAKISVQGAPQGGCFWSHATNNMECTFTSLDPTKLSIGARYEVSIIQDSETFHHEPVYITVRGPDNAFVEHDPRRRMAAFCSLCYETTALDCPQDCNGEYGGAAYKDSCGVCAGGNTSRIPDKNLDCAGLCYGHFKLVPQPGSSSQQCLCTEGSIGCSNYTLYKHTSSSIGQSSMCVSPNITRANINSLVHISMQVAPQQCQTTTACVVECLFGNVHVTGRYDRGNNTMRCQSPQIFQVDNATSVVIPIRLQINGVLHNSSTFLSVEYLFPTDSRYNVTISERDHGMCTSCARFHPDFCKKDCTGTYSGTARIDDCGLCVEGSTGMGFNQMADCAGICQGNFLMHSVPITSIYPTGEACYCDLDVGVCMRNTFGAVPRTIFENRGGGGGTREPPYPSHLLYQRTCLSPQYLPKSGFINTDYYLRIGTEHDVCPAVGHSCIVQCKVGDATVLGRFIVAGNYIECQPAGLAVPTGSNATVAVYVLVNSVVLPTNALFLTFVDTNSPLIGSNVLKNASSVSALCDRCHTVTNRTCYRDCSGVWMGSAKRDGCGVCAGGSTGIAPDQNVDCQGVCNGPFQLLGNGLCACNRTRKACVEAGRTSVFTRHHEETLCITPSLLPASPSTLPITLKVMGGELMNAPPALPFELKFGGSMRTTGAYYDQHLKAIICTSLPGLVDSSSSRRSVTVGVRISFLNGGGEAGPFVFITLDPSLSPLDNTLQLNQKGCGECSTFNALNCKTDCAGIGNGDAYIDDCGTCVGGSTKLLPNQEKDCQGICFGPFRQNQSGDCICPFPSHPPCLNYRRDDSNTDDAADATFAALDGYYIALLSISTIFIGAVVACAAYLYATGQSMEQLSRFPCDIFNGGFRYNYALL